MSEPYSLFLSARITRADVAAYLNAARVRADAYDDWAKTKFFSDDGMSREECKAWLRKSDAFAGATYGDAFVALRGTAERPDFRVYYDDVTSTFRHVHVLYSQGGLELAASMGVLRGLHAFLREGDTGFCAVHDPFIGNGTAGVIKLTRGGSEVVKTSRAFENEIGEMVAEFGGHAIMKLVFAKKSKGAKAACRDELDALRAG